MFRRRLLIVAAAAVAAAVTEKLLVSAAAASDEDPPTTTSSTTTADAPPVEVNVDDPIEASFRKRFYPGRHPLRDVATDMHVSPDTSPTQLITSPADEQLKTDDPEEPFPTQATLADITTGEVIPVTLGENELAQLKADIAGKSRVMQRSMALEQRLAEEEEEEEEDGTAESGSSVRKAAAVGKGYRITLPEWPGAGVSSNFVPIGMNLYWRGNPSMRIFPKYPNLMRPEEKSFDKTDGDWAERYYEMYFDSQPHCNEAAVAACRSAFDDKLETAYFSSDKSLRECMRQIPSNCNVYLYGFHNYTRIHPPQFCMSHSVGMRLPTPGGIVPVRDCKYEPLNIQGANIKSISDFEIPNLEWWGRGFLCDPESGPYWRNCRSGIQWGRGNVPDQFCNRRDWVKSELNLEEEWGFSAPGPYDWRNVSYLTAKWGYWAPLHERPYNGWRINIRLNFEPSRIDYDADGFIWSPAWVYRGDYLDNFYGADVAFRCETVGLRDAFEVLPEKPVDQSNLLLAALRDPRLTQIQ